jgi:hypothetical protein
MSSIVGLGLTYLAHEINDFGSGLVIVVSVIFRFKYFKELLHADNLRIVA